MIVFPAIDIKDGKVVRLAQGKFNKLTVYSEDPIEIAKKWADQGAEWLHVVDLDGAQIGKPQNTRVIADIAKRTPIPIQVGGGIRNEEDIERLVDAGAGRVIIGTKAVEDLDFLRSEIHKWGEKIAVSLDCANGKVATRAWTATSDVLATLLIRQLEDIGLFCVIYTDISKDGMLDGPNITELEKICGATSIPVIASGGVASLNDIENLLPLRHQGLMGVITGKAIYEGTLDLSEAIKLCSLNE